LVVIKLAAVVGPLLALAWLVRVFPDRRLISLALVPGLLSFGLLGTPGFFWPLVGLDVALGLVIVADLATLPRRAAFSTSRRGSTRSGPGVTAAAGGRVGIVRTTGRGTENGLTAAGPRGRASTRGASCRTTTGRGSSGRGLRLFRDQLRVSSGAEVTTPEYRTTGPVRMTVTFLATGRQRRST